MTVHYNLFGGALPSLGALSGQARSPVCQSSAHGRPNPLHFLVTLRRHRAQAGNEEAPRCVTDKDWYAPRPPACTALLPGCARSALGAERVARAVADSLDSTGCFALTELGFGAPPTDRQPRDARQRARAALYLASNFACGRVN